MASQHAAHTKAPYSGNINLRPVISLAAEHQAEGLTGRDSLFAVERLEQPECVVVAARKK